ncbi:MAG: 50S ribosomal protein L24 [Parcubacteria group bacterium]|nr:50S ribosomal protein L24 [Parcubacteria group bacterium]
MKIKKGDNVIIIGGKEKGKKGKVIKVFPQEQLIIVENINLKKKHQKPKTGGKKGEKIETPRPISVSSVMLICKNCGKPVRTGYKILNGPPDGEASKKIRICKKCGLEV